MMGQSVGRSEATEIEACAIELRQIVTKGRDLSYNGPRRGDVVEAWIKQWRDRYPRDLKLTTTAVYHTIDAMLDDYRLHADTGTPLDQPASDGGDPENAGAYV